MFPHGIMFHHFFDNSGKHPRGQGAISEKQFSDLIERLQAEHEIINADEWIERATGRSLKNNQICLSFDDGLKCQFEVALDVMKQRQIKPFWFVYSSVIQGNLEWLEVYRYFRTVNFSSVDDFYKTFFDQLGGEDACQEMALKKQYDETTFLAAFPFYSKNDKLFRFLRDDVLTNDEYHQNMLALMLKADFDPKAAANNLWMSADDLKTLTSLGHVIGLHSHSHPTRLEKLPMEKQRDEYRKNYEAITEITGIRPISMSHPCNSYDSQTLKVLRDMGIKVGFRANMQTSDWSELEHPREDHANLIRKMEGAAQ